jgi:hypothetical protein
MKNWEALESLVLSLRKSGKSWDQVEEEVNKRKLLQNHGSNLELFADLKAMEGKSLKELPQREMNRVFAKILKNHPGLKPTGIPMRDKVWDEGVHCYRRHLRDFASFLERQGSVDQFLQQEEEKGQLQPVPCSDGARGGNDNFDELLMVKECAKNVGGLERLKRICDVLLQLQQG